MSDHIQNPAALAATTNDTEGAQFQQSVRQWMKACFGPVISADKTERNHRFLEEAIELVQAGGCTASEAHQLVDYVFGRPVGELGQEVGGTMVTLAALCLAHDVDMRAEAERELARINVPETVAKIRAKQAAKPKHSPLPAAPSTVTPLPAVLEKIAQGWDGCKYDAPGETLDIGADIRAAAKRLLAEQPAAVAGPAREEIAALRAEHGITSTGRGIKEFEQVDAFVRAVLQRWGAAPALEAPAAPASDLFDCEVRPHPLRYPLEAYHHAPGSGPLHATWQDKPHRIVYDLVAAVRHYATLAAAPQAPAAPSDAGHQRDLLAQALGECILAAGIVRKNIDGMSGPQLLLFAEDLKQHLAAPAAPSAAATQVIEGLLALARIVNVAVEDWGETKEDDSLHVIFHKEQADKLEEILNFFDTLPDAPPEEGVILSGPSRAARVLRAMAAPASPAAPVLQLAAARAGRIYVAGPMTGMPDHNFPAFNEAAADLRAKGWHVENPAEHGIVEGATYADYLHYDMGRLATCCAIYLLPGWEKSKGACLEVHVAATMGIEIHHAEGAQVATPLKPSQAAIDVMKERQRQVDVEGWTPERDDQYVHGDLASAASCYAISGRLHYPVPGKCPPLWPWPAEWWKPGTYERNLQKAGAMIIAELERVYRAKANAVVP